jgi:DNA-binding NarL/FixJ family response regulator
METVMRGDIHVSPSLAKQMVTDVARGDRGGNDIASLSDREMQVFELIGRGFHNRRIAATMSLSGKTVDAYREAIKRKLGFADSIALLQHATLWVHEHGMAPPGSPGRQP